MGPYGAHMGPMGPIWAHETGPWGPGPGAYAMGRQTSAKARPGKKCHVQYRKKCKTEA